MDKVELAARKVLAAAAEGDALRTQMVILRRLAKHDPVDTIALGREVAGHVVKVGRYSI
jgi:butyryl-CoA dehydrogenase